MNTVPNEIEICFSFALIEAAIATIALAPQIAVPEDIRSEVFWSTLKIFARVKPIIIVKMIKNKTYKNSDIDNSEIEEIGYPKPIKTIEVLSNVLVSLFVLPSYGFPKIKVKIIPIVKANQDEILISGYNKEMGMIIINPKKYLVL